MQSAQEIAAKWAARMASAGEAYRNGIANVSENPMEAAARRQDAYVEGVTRAASEGKWRAGLLRTSFANWKQITSTKGAERLASGARAATEKMQRFLGEFLPVAAQMSAVVKDMPKGTEDAALARVAAAMRLAKQFAQSRR